MRLLLSSRSLLRRLRFMIGWVDDSKKAGEAERRGVPRSIA
jgi:hypothetical protein